MRGKMKASELIKHLEEGGEIKCGSDGAAQKLVNGCLILSSGCGSQHRVADVVAYPDMFKLIVKPQERTITVYAPKVLDADGYGLLHHRLGVGNEYYYDAEVDTGDEEYTKYEITIKEVV